VRVLGPSHRGRGGVDLFNSLAFSAIKPQLWSKYTVLCLPASFRQVLWHLHSVCFQESLYYTELLTFVFEISLLLVATVHCIENSFVQPSLTS